MTRQQAEVQRIEDTTTARMLRQEQDFLARFVAPRSPSEVAASVGMAPNLAHHHTRKLADAGLLFEQCREGGKVYYQLTAREFRVPSRLLPPDGLYGNGSADMRELSEAFLRAYGRSWAHLHEGEEDVFGFGDGARPAALPQRYQRLARALSALLAEAAAEGHSPRVSPAPWPC